MIKQLEQDIEALREEQGQTSTVSYLMENFKWWQPIYVPRGEAKDPEAAEKAAITRGVFNLSDDIKKAIFNKTKIEGDIVRKDESSPWLHQIPQEIPEQFDLNTISEALGGNTKRGNTSMQDYVIKLDKAFEEFTENLSYVYGGSKGTTTPSNYKPKPEYEKLQEAVVHLYDVSDRGDKATKQELQDVIKLFREKLETAAREGGINIFKGLIPES